MKSVSCFFRNFSEEQLDQAECLIKREHPDLWVNLIRPTPSQMNNSDFYHDFLQIVRGLTFLDGLSDVTALCYGLYNRVGR